MDKKTKETSVQKNLKNALAAIIFCFILDVENSPITQWQSIYDGGPRAASDAKNLRNRKERD